MKVCPACGRRSDTTSDFCSCGEYLGWVPVEAVIPLGTPETIVLPASPVRARPDGGANPAAPLAGGPSPPSPPSPPPTETEPTPRRVDRPPPANAGAPGGPGAENRSLTVLLGIYRSRAERDSSIRAAATVAAGSSSRLFALIQNQSGIVDNYDQTIDGLPSDWWTIRPPTAYLVPLGRGEGYQQELEIVLHPPRTPAAEARPWTFHLIATSRSSGQPVAAAGATLTIEPYHDLGVEVIPPLADGRLGARFEAFVTNQGNSPARVAVSLEDDEQNLTFEPDGRVVTFRALRHAVSPFSELLRKRAGKMATKVKAPTAASSGLKLPKAGQKLVSKTVADQRKQATAKADDALASATGASAIDPALGPTVLVIEPGDSASVAFLVRPRAQQWIGRRTNRRFAVKAAELEADAKPSVAPAILRQRPWLPTWITLVVVLILIAIALLLLLRPKHEVFAIPNVVNAKSAHDAEQTLEKAGFVMSPDVQTKLDSKDPPGTVLSQTPEPPFRAAKGTSVSITVATSVAMAKVPSVHGETLVQANKKLTAAGLTLGSASPKPDPKEIVSTQLPLADSERPKGTPVNVFLVPRPKKKASGATGATGTTGAAGAAGAAAGGAAGGMVAVPAFAGSQLSSYQKKLASAELSGKETYKIDPSPAGTVLTSVPKPGTKVKTKSVVELAVSAGFPLLSYDNGGNLAAVAGASGASSNALAIDKATEPAWDLSGNDLAFVRGPSILVRTTGQASDDLLSLAPSAAGTSHDNPAFAPTHRGEIIASISHTANLDSLCFSQIVSGRVSALSCLPVPGWNLGSITWGRSGFSLLVAATKSDSLTTFGLLQFFSSIRFAAQASYWETPGTLVTPTPPGGLGVLQAAISPDGKQIAAIANLGGGSFHVMLTSIHDLAFKAATTLPTTGCDVAWRSDGGELAVGEGDSQCLSQDGPIIGVSPATPKTVTTLVLKGENPAWQPIDLNPGH